MNKRKVYSLVAALPNIGRGLMPMMFNGVIFYFLKTNHLDILLDQYTWFLLTSYFIITFTGWGLRDFMVKEYTQAMNRQGELLSQFIGSKIPLLVIVLVGLCFSGFSLSLCAGIFLFVLGRTATALFDPLILVNNKTRSLFFAEVFLSGFFLLSIFLFPLIEKLVLLVSLLELLRALAGFLILSPPKISKIDFKQSLGILGQSWFYFLIALSSFCMSRADSYILGLFVPGSSFSHYNILVTLVTASQVIISSVYNRNVKSVFRLDISKATAVLDSLSFQFTGLSLVASFFIYAITSLVYKVEVPLICFPFLLANIYCFCLTVKLVFILNHLGKIRYFLAGSVAAFGTNSVCAVILTPVAGMLGALAANTLGAIVLIIVIRILLAFSARRSVAAESASIQDPGRL